ncbi:hypothetical protein [Sphingomonas oligophenolica]|uniref:Uncharacterized protein n=1 Tax=Sphingomonas oligophenolica TaxID=301154 RepID=A0A502BZ89_9SPHN|nr:hypothetical protein [Sphingomonas oligophenolica]TPG05850.1 hypothetical protein EAH84_15050 [Sphingomonas oligophenolica]
MLMASDPVHAAQDRRALRRRGLTLALLTAAYFFSSKDRAILAIGRHNRRRRASARNRCVTRRWQ